MQAQTDAGALGSQNRDKEPRWSKRIQVPRDEVDDWLQAFPRGSTTYLVPYGPPYTEYLRLFSTEITDDMDAYTADRVADDIVTRMNGIAQLRFGLTPAIGGAILEIVDGQLRGTVHVSANIEIEISVGVSFGDEPTPTDWLRASRDNDRLAEAISYLADVSWFSLFKAFEALQHSKLLNLSPAMKQRSKHFTRTANALHRHALNAEPPDTPMTLTSAKRFIIQCINLTVSNALKDLEE